MAIFRDVHEPIIDRTTFDKIQATVSKRKKPTKTGERSIFSGLLVCADYGGNLHFHFNQKNHDIKFFSCSNYNKSIRTCDSTHYIRVDFLEQVVLAELKRLAKFVTQYEAVFTQAVEGYARAVAQETMKQCEAECTALQARTNQLDTLFERLYEDNVSGKISDERFRKMSDRYETEQGEITARLQTLKQQLDTQKAKIVTTDDFRKAVKNLTRIRKLTPLMVNELIEKIEVHHAEKQDGIQTQKLTIHYHVIGPIAIPDNLPVPDITMDTRKGVKVTYQP